MLMCELVKDVSARDWRSAQAEGVIEPMVNLKE